MPRRVQPVEAFPAAVTTDGGCQLMGGADVDIDHNDARVEGERVSKKDEHQLDGGQCFSSPN